MGRVEQREKGAAMKNLIRVGRFAITMRTLVAAIIALTIFYSMVFWGIGFALTLVGMAVTGFFQNMAFTAVSRSRTAGDPEYHRKCAWASNGVWLVCQLFIWKHLWLAFSSGVFVQLMPLMLVYIMATTEGSVTMMERLLKTETGKRRVGAR
jgi:hypothetical protein